MKPAWPEQIIKLLRMMTKNSTDFWGFTNFKQSI